MEEEEAKNRQEAMAAAKPRRERKRGRRRNRRTWRPGPGTICAALLWSLWATSIRERLPFWTRFRERMCKRGKPGVSCNRLVSRSLKRERSRRKPRSWKRLICKSLVCSSLIHPATSPLRTSDHAGRLSVTWLFLSLTSCMVSNNKLSFASKGEPVVDEDIL